MEEMLKNLISQVTELAAQIAALQASNKTLTDQIADLSAGQENFLEATQEQVDRLCDEVLRGALSE